MRKNPALDLCCLCCYATVNAHEVVVQTRGKQLYKQEMTELTYSKDTLAYTRIFKWFRGMRTFTNDPKTGW
jgi:predicted transcriptional regulator